MNRWDWVQIVGILIVIIGGVLVVFESKKCSNPLQTITESVLKTQNITDLNYSYVEVSFYDGNAAFPIKSYKLSPDGSGYIERVENIKYEMFEKDILINAVNTS